METHINNELIRSFGMDFDPASFGIPDNESLSVKEWILKYSDVLKQKVTYFGLFAEMNSCRIKICDYSRWGAPEKYSS